MRIAPGASLHVARALTDLALRERALTQLAPLPALTLARDLLLDRNVASSPASLGALLLARDGAQSLARSGADELAAHVATAARAEADRITGVLATEGLAGHPDYAGVGGVAAMLDLLLSMHPAR